jgi:hypothetical protein
MPPRVEAKTEAEKWLRTSEAFDVVTDRWLAQLDRVDPALGHGFLPAEES